MIIKINKTKWLRRIKKLSWTLLIGIMMYYYIPFKLAELETIEKYLLFNQIWTGVELAGVFIIYLFIYLSFNINNNIINVRPQINNVKSGDNNT